MKERVRYSWLVREEFSCVKCGAGNDDISWNDKGSDHPAGQPEEVLFCKKCGHKLTEREELEELVPFIQYMRYSLYLRFAKSKKEFIPCEKCQKEIHEMLETDYWNLGSRVPIVFTGDMGDFRFELNFLVPQIHGQIPMNPASEDAYVPCKKCQKILKEFLSDCELIIGNKDYEPPVELNRKWIDNNEKQIALEKGQIITVNGRPFGKCRRCKKEKFLAIGKMNPKYVVDICNDCLRPNEPVEYR